jgi:hypothetical protein
MVVALCPHDFEALVHGEDLPKGFWMTDRIVSQKIALATVVSEDFLPGALVMISSFMARNPWFRGDVIIIHETLSDDATGVLVDSFPKVIMHPMAEPLRLRLNAVAEAVPWIGTKRAQFGSLEALSLGAYDRVIVCDSDLLFLDTIGPLFERSEPLICCADGAHLRGSLRKSDDFSEVPSGADPSGTLARTFNSGFMVLGPGLLNEQNYDAALSLITRDRWISDRTGHTDQMVFNLLFAGQQCLVSSTYNFTLLHRASLERVSGTLLDDAKVLHFNGPAKPWLPMATLKQTLKDPAMVFAYRKWQDGFAQFLARRGIMAAL